MSTHRVVIVGAGFAGVAAALSAAAEVRAQRAANHVEITVVSPDDAHVVRVRMYEDDRTGARVPLGAILSPVGVVHVQAEVVEVDPSGRRLAVADESGRRWLEYHQLVLCPGSHRALRLRGTHNHGIDTWAESLALHRELESLRSRPERRPRVVIVGAAFTGLELAAELSSHAEVELVDGAATIAPDFGPRARAVIAGGLGELGIRTHPGRRAAMLPDGTGVELDGGELIAADLTVWSTELRASELCAQLGVPLDQLGRLGVTDTLATEVPRVWAAGDGARASVDGRHLAVMSCQHALPQGRIAGANAVRAALGGKPERYRQPVYRTCLDLGAAGALLTTGFARDDVIATGEDAKRFKRMINHSLICPPVGSGPEPLLAFGRAGTPGRLVGGIQRLALRSSLLRRRATATAGDLTALPAA